jgi:hypothetical protein
MRKGVRFSIRIYNQFAFDALSHNVYFFRHVVMKHKGDVWLVTRKPELNRYEGDSRRKKL